MLTKYFIILFVHLLFLVVKNLFYKRKILIYISIYAKLNGKAVVCILDAHNIKAFLQK